MDGKLIAVRLEQKQLSKLAEMSESTGWNQSELIRQLINSAKVLRRPSPAAVKSSVGDTAKKGVAVDAE